MLNERILLCQSCSALVRSKISDLLMCDVVSHITMLSRNGIALPVLLRCQAFEKQRDHLFGEVSESQKWEAVKKKLEALADRLVVLPDAFVDPEANDLNISAQFIYSDFVQDSDADVATGALTSEDAQKRLEGHSEDCRGYWGVKKSLVEPVSK